jgi:hypothetical protein
MRIAIVVSMLGLSGCDGSNRTLDIYLGDTARGNGVYVGFQGQFDNTLSMVIDRKEVHEVNVVLGFHYDRDFFLLENPDMVSIGEIWELTKNGRQYREVETLSTKLYAPSDIAYRRYIYFNKNSVSRKGGLGFREDATYRQTIEIPLGVVSSDTDVTSVTVPLNFAIVILDLVSHRRMSQMKTVNITFVFRGEAKGT